MQHHESQLRNIHYRYVARGNRLDRKERCHCIPVSFALFLSAAAALAATPNPGGCKEVPALPEQSSTQPSAMERAYIHFNQGVAYEAMGNSAGALQCFNESYRLLPTHPLIQAKANTLGR